LFGVGWEDSLVFAGGFVDVDVDVVEADEV
jgi:hypothetical protein